jgi:hypothetical protein
MKCSICGKEIGKYGNGAYPVNSGKCCDECNLKLVVPARIKLAKIEIGDKIKIVKMLNEPDYDGKTGVVDHIDDAGQIHGSWGGCALICGIDDFTIINKE